MAGSPEITLGDIHVNRRARPYVIAEIGVNHEGSMETAKRLIELAKEGGAHGAKFQTYKAETLAAKESPSYWDLSAEPTDSQFALFKKHDSFGDDEYRELAAHCRAVGIDFLSTPFDDHAVTLLEPLVPFFKIASADITNPPLLRRVAQTGKPVILSTGASTIDEIRGAVDVLEAAGATDIALLHCILNYPCSYENAHLSMISGLAEAFPKFVIGYSDHTHPDPNMTVLSAAVALGARIIEKHFTHDKSLPGNDHYHAMDIDDLRCLSDNLDLLHSAFGDTGKAPLESEDISRLNARRSIVTARKISAGEAIQADAIIPKRPATGISPMHWDQVIGRTASHDLDEDHILTWDDLAEESA